MNVSMANKHGATYFNILAPGQNEVAMFNGSVSQNQYEGVLPESGDYKVRVHMMRSAAHRNEVANYRLEMIVSGAGDKSAAATGDSKVTGTGNMPCSMGGGSPQVPARSASPARATSTSCASATSATRFPMR